MQHWKKSERQDRDLNCREKYLLCTANYIRCHVFFFYSGYQQAAYRGNAYYRMIQMCSLDCGCSMALSLLKGPGQVMSDFNSHSHRLASPAFWRPIKPDSSPLSLVEGTQKAGKEQHSGMLKSSMMESVNSANGSLSPCCLVRFISWRSRWQKVYWTLTVSPYKWFHSIEQRLC